MNPPRHAEWPPRAIPCPQCKQEMIFYATGLGQRFYYQCNNKECVEPRHYARHPSLWCRHPEASNACEIRGHIDIMFLLEDGGTLLSAVARCSRCRNVVNGLYSKAATAGFVHHTKEDEGWREHHNDPTFTTEIICDACARQPHETTQDWHL